MKTLILKITALLFMIMLTNNISFSYDVELINPKQCPDHHSFIHHPSIALNCSFRVFSQHTFDSDTILYNVYIEHNGSQTFLSEGICLDGEQVNLSLNLQNIPDLCKNELAAVRVDARRFDSQGTTYNGRGYFVYYKPGKSCKNYSLTNGDPQLLTPDFIRVNFNSTCGGLASSIYIIKRTKIVFTLNGDFTDSIPVLEPSLGIGYSGAGPNNQHYWAGILDSTNSRYRFYTFTYEVYNLLGQYFGHLPTSANNAAVVYRKIKRTNVIPVIGAPVAFPRTVYTNNNISYINSNLLHGSDTIHYLWRGPAHSNYPLTLTPQGNRARLEVHYNNTLIAPEYSIFVHSKALNQIGESQWDSTEIFIRTETYSNSCPVAYTEIENKSFAENSILYESYETPGIPVNGNLILGNPNLDEGKVINLMIRESKSDITELDQIGITQLLVNPGEKVAVSRNGNYVSYTEEKGKLKVLKNNSDDVTEKLESDDYKTVEFEKDDQINVSFIPDGSNIIIFRAYEIVNKELPAGVITTDDGRDYVVYFLEDYSSACIEVESNLLSSFTFKALQTFKLNQILTVNNLNSFTINKLDLVSAVSQDNKDVSKYLLETDGQKCKISANDHIKMSFEGKIKDESRKSFYVINSNGQINVTGKESVPSERKLPEIINLTNNLSENLPNPFNPVTIIKYQIAGDAYVSLKVFDITGREIKTIVNDFKTAGKYEVVFDGSGISSGTYFYRLETSEGFKDTKRMILIK
ncbi:MAG TPA: T9SS type A sorting domain-containing protein [Ignavibacteria bacterium]|nr:T9SS type A sorting domain-containing protein [Ignavibacteria bacterium]